MKSKGYSVKKQGDGLSLKQRYQMFQEVKRRAVRDIEKHDPGMAASARRLLSIPREDTAAKQV